MNVKVLLSRYINIPDDKMANRFNPRDKYLSGRCSPADEKHNPPPPTFTAPFAVKTNRVAVSARTKASSATNGSPLKKRFMDSARVNRVQIYMK